MEKVGGNFWVGVNVMGLGMGIAGVGGWQRAVECARLVVGAQEVR